ncbi:MAG: hypothetical protein ACFFD6_08080 [Candidatus Thorarchaeota archaeon]
MPIEDFDSDNEDEDFEEDFEDDEDFEEEYEDDEDFEDEEYEDDNYLDDEDAFPEEVERAFKQQREGRLVDFLEDPWPITAFILILAGFGIILPWPEAIWFDAVYYLLSLYLLSVLGVVAIIFSLKAWVASETKFRFIAAVFVLVSLISLGVGFADTFSWALTGYSIIPALQTPLIVLLIVIEIFIIYSLWIMRSQFMKPEE